MEGNVEGRVRISEHAPSRKTLEKKSSRWSVNRFEHCYVIYNRRLYLVQLSTCYKSAEGAG